MIHESLHLDDEFQAQKIRELNAPGGCSAWGCQFELDVEARSKEVMNEGWLKATGE